jgi:hypothetical protein
MAIKKFKGKQLLKVQWYLRDTGMLYRDDAGNYYLREVLIQDIDQVLGITEPIEYVNWDEINSEVSARGSYDVNEDMFTTTGLNTMYALDLERYGKRKNISYLLIIAYLIYEGMRADLIEME